MRTTEATSGQGVGDAPGILGTQQSIPTPSADERRSALKQIVVEAIALLDDDDDDGDEDDLFLTNVQAP